MDSWEMLLVLCPLLFLAGFVDSVAGGGGLISLPAYLFAGIPVHLAAGTNKLVNSLGTAVATGSYLKHGTVSLAPALTAGAGSLLGGVLGVRLALWCSEALLQTCILAALPAAAVFLTIKRDLGLQPIPRTWTPGQKLLLSLLIGLVLGLYDGLIGPGTGTFLIMAFTLVLGVDLLTASGCAKVANLASNAAAAISWTLGGKVLWPLVPPAAACCILGNWCGARYALRGGAKRVRGMIFLVLALLFLKLGWELLRT